MIDHTFDSVIVDHFNFLNFVGVSKAVKKAYEWNFGDVNNSEDIITEKAADSRAYHLLESIGARPNVVYQVKVKNTQEV